jgi:nucleoside-diphosphate-sugar epimerase
MMREDNELRMEHAEGVVLVTGATGLLGARILQRWASCSTPPAIAVLVRDPLRWREAERRLGIPSGTTVVLEGDVTRDGLGLTRVSRAWLAERVTAAVHLAADTTFSRPLEVSRATNREGTRHLLGVLADCPLVTRLAHVSTAFVAGRRTGCIPESALGAAGADIGWVNAYEQSKAEAESLVREARKDCVILRSSTVACDDVGGEVTQRNAVHRALRLFHDGFAAMIPGIATSALDAVPADYVADGIARIALRADVDGDTVHLCAGAGAMPLDELLDDSYARWARDTAWRRRGISRPSLGDLDTWELFASAVEETGHPRLRQVTHALSHFLPQLGLPKQFVTARADELLGVVAPPVREYWGRMIDHLEATSWHGVSGLTEVAA